MRIDRQNASRRLLPVVAVMGAGCLLGVAGESEPGFYLRGGVGATMISDTELTAYPGVGSVSGVDVELDTGFAVAAAVGYQIKPFLAAEFETGFTYNEVDTVASQSPSGDASLSQVPMLVNLVFQVPMKCGFVPFAGAGAGGVLQTASFDEYGGISTTGGGGLDGSDSDLVFGWQAFAGIRYDFNEQMGVGLTYRYLMTDGPEWDVDTGSREEPLALDDIESHTLTAQFTYRF